MDIQDIVRSLHPLERKVVPKLNDGISLKALVVSSGLQEVEVMRALQWLENKDVLKINVTVKDVVSLDKNGLEYYKNKMPERIFIDSLKNGEKSLEDIKHNTKLSDEEVNVCVGILKQKASIDVKKTEKGMIISLTKHGEKWLTKNTYEEDLVVKIGKGILELNVLKDFDKLALDNLKKRKGIVKVENIKERTVILTSIGKELIKQEIKENVIESLNPSMIKNASWKDKEFRAYDIKINVPKISRGKRHFVDQAIDYIKQIWLEMGFQEMEGNIVQTSFWDLDSLFVPQDHPAREMQDTFYVEGKKGKVRLGTLPILSKKVKLVHENGGDTGSRGWGGQWYEDKAKEVLLRTHTTVLSAQTISKLKKEELPAKFFSVGKVFRNEALDWKHLFEFYQVEGIVVDPNANLRNLIGYLKEFYRKMGFTDIKIRPAHFPYTEPSVEIEVYHPVKKQWIELGGAGIFRPEVTKTLLGFECPVLAWGQGMERIIVDYYKFTDLRELYKNDIKQLKEIKEWMVF